MCNDFPKKPFDLEAILTKYQYDKYKAIRETKKALSSLDYTRKEQELILLMVEAFFKAEERDKDSGTREKRRLTSADED